MSRPRVHIRFQHASLVKKCTLGSIGSAQAQRYANELGYVDAVT